MKIKKLFNNIFILGIVFLLLFSFVKLTFADTNGIWTLAQDVRGGTFGSDEQDVTSFYKFINPVYFIDPINVSIIYSTYSKDYYINLSGRSQLNTIATNGVSTNSLELNNLKSCSGKLYTDSNGNVVCGTDNVNDADSDPTNELQNLYQVLSRGNNAGGQKITNLGYPYYSSDAATKSYVDNQISSVKSPWIKNSYGIYYNNHVSIGTSSNKNNLLNVIGSTPYGYCTANVGGSQYLLGLGYCNNIGSHPSIIAWDSVNNKEAELGIYGSTIHFGGYSIFYNSIKIQGNGNPYLLSAIGNTNNGYISMIAGTTTDFVGLGHLPGTSEPTVIMTWNTNTRSNDDLGIYAKAIKVHNQQTMEIINNLKVDGTIYGTVSSSSDRRLKTDLKNLTNVLTKINNITPIYYKWNNLAKSYGLKSNRTQIGLIAQNLDKSFPELVNNETLCKKNNDSDCKTYLSIDYAKTTAVLIEAIKEQQKEINELKEEINNLKK